MIVFGKLVEKTYSSGEFNLYRLKKFGGGWYTGVYIGAEPPKPLKTVEYQLTGDWKNHPKYGKQFVITGYERSKTKATTQPKHWHNTVREFEIYSELMGFKE